MTQNHKKGRGLFWLLAMGSLFLAGCSPAVTRITSYDKQLDVRFPSVEIDRYETVVFPAGKVK